MKCDTCKFKTVYSSAQGIDPKGPEDFFCAKGHWHEIPKNEKALESFTKIVEACLGYDRETGHIADECPQCEGEAFLLSDSWLRIECPFCGGSGEKEEPKAHADRLIAELDEFCYENNICLECAGKVASCRRCGGDGNYGNKLF